MSKYLFLFAIVVVGLFLAPTVSAQMGMRGRVDNFIGTSSADQPEVSLDEAVAEILEFQGVGSVDEVDCENITDSQFERLGDAWMETIHPGEAHERMDAMMGGEGSATLREAHINMGTRYLGCPGNREGRGWKPHMGMMPWAGMMGGEWTGGSGFQSSGLTLFWITWVVTILLLDALLVTLIRYFWKKGR